MRYSLNNIQRMVLLTLFNIFKIIFFFSRMSALHVRTTLSIRSPQRTALRIQTRAPEQKSTVQRLPQFDDHSAICSKEAGVVCSGASYNALENLLPFLRLSSHRCVLYYCHRCSIRLSPGFIECLIIIMIEREGENIS